MWKTARYTIRMIGYRPVAASILLFGGALFLVASTPHAGGFPGFVKYLVILSSLLAAVLLATACRPEDVPLLESSAVLRRPFWQSVAAAAALDLGIVWIAAALIGLGAAIALGNHDLELLGPGLAAVVANSLFFGGLALFGTVLGCSSQAGLLLSLILLAIPLLGSFPESVATVPHPYVVVSSGQASPAWWISRLSYAAVGATACILGLSWLRNTDRLLVRGRLHLARFSDRGSSSDPRSLRSATPRSVSTRLLPRAASRVSGLMGYETLLAVLRGVAPLLVLVVCVAVGSITLLPPLFQGQRDVLIEQLLALPSVLSYIFFLLLPLVLSDTVSADRRAGLDQSLLAIISPPRYLWGKVLGACGAVLALAFLGNLLVLLPAAILVPPRLLLIYGGLLLLSLLPAVAYASAISVLGGALAGPRHPLFVGVATTVGFLALLLLTRNSVLGNVLFPSGLMASNTLSNLAREWFSTWMFEQEGVQYLYSSSLPQLVVPLPWLALPLVSIMLQISLLLPTIGKIFEKEITRK